MEYLQGRALTNAIGNLDLNGPYADALRKLGYELEEIAEQVLFQYFETLINSFLSLHWSCLSFYVLVILGERCSSGKWWFGETRLVFLGFHGHPQLACLGLWFEVQTWPV